MLTIKLNVTADTAAALVRGLSKMLIVPDPNLEEFETGQDIIANEMSELGPEALVFFEWKEEK